MENTSDSFMPRPLLFCLKSGRSVCYSVPDNTEEIDRMEKEEEKKQETIVEKRMFGGAADEQQDVLEE